MPLVEKTFTSDSYRAFLFVEKECQGMRLDLFVGRHEMPFSREKIKRKIAQGEIVIEGRSPGRQRPNTRVRAGEKIAIVSYNKKNISGPSPRIVFEDEDIVVISKPPFMLTHPTGRHLFYCATTFLPGPTHSIHRLDRETSGLLLLGKNARVARELAGEFERGAVKKSYFFVAKKNHHYCGQNSFRECAALIPCHLEHGRVRMVPTGPEVEGGKRAETDFRLLANIDTYVLGLAFPKTGRQHQIRVHAAINGLPLLGDKLYLGGDDLFRRFQEDRASEADRQLMEIDRQALHALGLSVSYKRERRIFMDTLPQDLEDWLHSLEGGKGIGEKACRLTEDYFRDSG